MNCPDDSNLTVSGWSPDVWLGYTPTRRKERQSGVPQRGHPLGREYTCGNLLTKVLSNRLPPVVKRPCCGYLKHRLPSHQGRRIHAWRPTVSAWLWRVVIARTASPAYRTARKSGR